MPYVRECGVVYTDVPLRWIADTGVAARGVNRMTVRGEMTSQERMRAAIAVSRWTSSNQPADPFPGARSNGS